MPNSIYTATQLTYQQLGIAYRQLGLLLDDISSKQAQDISRLTHVAEQQRAEIETLKKRLADLDEYLKRCGDKPGCTSPANETKSGGELRPSHSHMNRREG